MCGHHRQVAREWQHQYCIDLRLLQHLQLDRQRGEQLRRDIRPQDPQRMRLECNYHGLATDGMSPLGHVTDHLLMSPVYAVEVADTYHRGAEVGGDFVEVAEDLHSGRR